MHSGCELGRGDPRLLAPVPDEVANPMALTVINWYIHPLEGAGFWIAFRREDKRCQSVGRSWGMPLSIIN
jgi:hypothetical protein